MPHHLPPRPQASRPGRPRHARGLPALGLAALLGSMLLSAPALAQDPANGPERKAQRYLDVQAQSELDIAPDEATLSARLWEKTPAVAQEEDSGDHGQALGDARTRLEERAAELVRTLEEAGLERDAISAGSLSVQQEMLHRPGTDNEAPTVMVRTRLERPVTLSISDLDSLPTILDALTDAGVNSLDGVSYDLADRDAASDQALTQALQRARQKAELMAETLGVELGEVVSISETNAPVFQPRMMAMRADAAMESGGGAEYRPGAITIDAGVNVRWSLAP